MRDLMGRIVCLQVLQVCSDCVLINSDHGVGPDTVFVLEINLEVGAVSWNISCKHTCGLFFFRQLLNPGKRGAAAIVITTARFPGSFI